MSGKPTYEELEKEVARLKEEKGKIREYARFLQGSLDAMDDSVFIKNEEHVRVFSNIVGASQKGYNPKDLVGKTDDHFHDKGYWQQVDVFVKDHSEADFTHGYCPECAQKALAEIDMPDKG